MGPIMMHKVIIPAATSHTIGLLPWLIVGRERLLARRERVFANQRRRRRWSSVRGLWAEKREVRDSGVREELGHRDVPVIQGIPFVEEFCHTDVIGVEELIDRAIKELGDGDIIVFEVLGQDSVEELNDCDVVVPEELRYGSVQVLEHGDNNIIRPLTEVLGHCNPILSLRV